MGGGEKPKERNTNTTAEGGGPKRGRSQGTDDEDNRPTPQGGTRLPPVFDLKGSFGLIPFGPPSFN